MPKEIICVNVGQAGVQISSALWELFCIEHGLDCQGNNRADNATLQDEYFPGLHAIFNECQAYKYVPRAINVDLEPTVIDEVRTGPYKNLWHPDALMSGLEDASNNYARGYFSIGKRMIKNFRTQLTRLIRDCNSIHGFIIISSYGGGTGSGFSNLILDFMNEEYVKTTKIACVIFPSPLMSTAVVEPYNGLLSSISSFNNIELALMFDNEAMFDSCHTKMNIMKPSYNNVNRIVAQVLSSLTVTLRFGSSLDHDLVHLQTNLVPYPQMHFPFVNFSPMLDKSRMDHKEMSTINITRDLFDSGSQLIKCDVELGRYMACCLLYRGFVLPREINVALMDIKQTKNIQFVEWCPTGFKVGISSMPPSTVGAQLAVSDKNCAMFCNSSAIEQVWERIHRKFTYLYCKRSFIHWYVGEGMEEMEFKETKEKVTQLQRDYVEITRDEVGDFKKSTEESKLYIDEIIKESNNFNFEINENAMENPTETDDSEYSKRSMEVVTSSSTFNENRHKEIRYLLKTIKGAQSITDILNQE